MDRKSASALLRKAELELRETETRKRQSLEQFRDWLRKHECIRHSRQDDTYLLMYLRTKKFSLNDACRLYESHFSFRSKRSDWFDITEPKRKRIRELVECGAKYFINDPESINPAVCIARFDRFHLERNPITDSFHADFGLFGAYLELENVQISGFCVVLDFSNVPLTAFASLPVNDTLDWVRSLSACPGRFKRFILVCLPSTAHALLNLVKTILPAKMRERIALARDYGELADLVDARQLPKDYGGEADERDLIRATLRTFDENLPALRLSHKYDIEWSAAGGESERVIASFRKLEID